MPRFNRISGVRETSLRTPGSPTSLAATVLRTEVGLMAQDVEKVNPEAVAEIGGIKHVDYARATSYSAGLDRYMRMAV